MPNWIIENAGLWALLALPIMALAAFPAFAQLRASARDRGRTLDEIYNSLLATNGRVSGSKRRATLTNTNEILPATLTTEQGRSPAIKYAYEKTKNGRSLLITGEAGSGKSHILADLHYHSYQHATNHTHPLIEVVELIELLRASRTFKRFKPERDIFQSAIRVVASRYRLSRNAVRQLISESKLIIAFDGLDELPKADRRATAAQIAEYALQRPVILTTRPSSSGADTNAGPDDPLSTFAGAPIQRAEVDPLAWDDVSTTLARIGIPMPHTRRIAPSARRHLCIPLQFQILIFLWRRHKVDEAELPRLLREPSALIDLLIQGESAPGKDRALCLAGVMLADKGRDKKDIFRTFPIELAGLAFRTSKVVTAAPFMAYGLYHGAFISAPVITIALLLSSPYPNSIWATRATSGWTGKFSSLLSELRVLLFSFILVHACRIASWSIQSGQPFSGGLSAMFDLYWLWLTFVVWAFLTASPFGRNSNILSLSRTGGRPWLQYIIFGTCSYAILIDQIELTILLAGWAYSGAGCIYLWVGTMYASLITRTPPWKWGRLLDDLVDRGVLTRVGERLRFVHGSVRIRVARSLAGDSGTSPLLWRTFNADWESLLIEEDAGPLALIPNPTFERTVGRLARRDAWSPPNVNTAICYYQWIALQSQISLSLLRRHLSLLPRSSLRALLPDTLDRMGDPSGLILARTKLGRNFTSAFELHWLLRVVERYDSYLDLEAILDDIGSRQSLSSEMAEVLDIRRRKYLVGQLGEDCSPHIPEQLEELARTADPIERSMIALERNPPELVDAQRQLDLTEESAITLARTAQVMSLRGDHAAATEVAALAGARLTSDIGYDPTLEVMLTMATVGASPEAAAWLGRAAAAGLRLRGRPGLRRNLDISEGCAADIVLSDFPSDPAPARSESS